jgi:hypothetical protein
MTWRISAMSWKAVRIWDTPPACCRIRSAFPWDLNVDMDVSWNGGTPIPGFFIMENPNLKWMI